MKKKILIVDDEQEIVDLLMNIVQDYSSNLDLLSAKNGKEAIEIIKNNKVSILFTDLKMPNVTGVDLIKQIKDLEISQKPNAILVISALVKEVGKFSADLNITTLNKPFKSEEIERYLDAVLDLDLENVKIELNPSLKDDFAVELSNDIKKLADLTSNLERDFYDTSTWQTLLTIIKGIRATSLTLDLNILNNYTSSFLNLLEVGETKKNLKQSKKIVMMLRESEAIFERFREGINQPEIINQLLYKVKLEQVKIDRLTQELSQRN